MAFDKTQDGPITHDIMAVEETVFSSEDDPSHRPGNP